MVPLTLPTVGLMEPVHPLQTVPPKMAVSPGLMVAVAVKLLALPCGSGATLTRADANAVLLAPLPSVAVALYVVSVVSAGQLENDVVVTPPLVDELPCVQMGVVL